MMLFKALLTIGFTLFLAASLAKSDDKLTSPADVKVTSPAEGTTLSLPEATTTGTGTTEPRKEGETTVQAQEETTTPSSILSTTEMTSAKATIESTSPPTSDQKQVSKMKAKHKCVDFEASIKLVVDYPNTQAGNSKKEFQLHSKDQDVKCTKDFITATLKTDQDWKLILTYKKNGKMYNVAKIELDYVADETHFPDATSVFIGSHKLVFDGISLFPTPLSKPCNWDQQVEIKLGDHESLQIEDYKTKAFKDAIATGVSGSCEKGDWSSPKVKRTYSSLNTKQTTAGAVTTQEPTQTPEVTTEAATQEPTTGTPSQESTTATPSQESTTATTTQQVTSTATSQEGGKPEKVFKQPLANSQNSVNFSSYSVPRTVPGEGCLKLDISFKIAINYTKNDNATARKEFELEEPSYTGVCDLEMKSNSLTIKGNKDWELSFLYTVEAANKSIYRLSQVNLTYRIDEQTFENVSQSLVGTQVASTPAGLSLFSTKTQSSYKCTAPTAIQLGDDVSLVVDYYHGQPFTTKDLFDTAEECHSIAKEASCGSFGIYVGVSLGILVLAILIVFKIFKNRPGFKRNLQPTSRFP